MDKEKLYFIDDLEVDLSGIVILTRADAVLSLPWRTMAIGMISSTFFIIALLIFLLTYLIGKTRFNRRIRKGWLPVGSSYRKLPIFCMCTIFLLFMIKEFFGALYPDDMKMQMIFKSAIGASSIAAAYVGYTRNKKLLSQRLLIALILLACADIVTTVSLPVGSLLHIASYAVLTYTYWTEERPDKKQIVVLGIMSLIGLFFILSIKGEYGLLRLLAAIYLIASMTMVCTSFSLPRRVFTGSILLFAAGCLLMFNEINGKTFLSHIVSLGTYYLAISFLACANTRVALPKLVPESVLYIQQEEE